MCRSQLTKTELRNTDVFFERVTNTLLWTKLDFAFYKVNLKLPKKIVSTNTVFMNYNKQVIFINT